MELLRTCVPVESNAYFELTTTSLLGPAGTIIEVQTESGDDAIGHLWRTADGQLIVDAIAENSGFSFCNCAKIGVVVRAWPPPAVQNLSRMNHEKIAAMSEL